MRFKNYLIAITVVIGATDVSAFFTLRAFGSVIINPASRARFVPFVAFANDTVADRRLHIPFVGRNRHGLQIGQCQVGCLSVGLAALEIEVSAET